jgi:hypothetical protein
MKTTYVLASVFAAVSGLAGLATSARAGTDFHHNIGIGSRPGPVIVAPRGAPVVVVPASPGYGYGYGHGRPAPVYRDACPPPAPRGYWTEVPVKVWVPAEWIVSRGHHGRDVRTLRPGYFTYRHDRVWVADAGRPGDFGHGHGHNDFGHGRGRG